MTKYLFSTRYILFILILFSYNLGFSQDSLSSKTKKSNSIVYGEFFFGPSTIKGEDTFSWGLGLSYQYKKNIFTLRHTENLPALFVFNNVSEREKDTELAFLYGLRKIDQWASYNVSFGLSINKYTRIDEAQPYDLETTYNYVGLPYDISFKFFKAKKRRYWLIFPAYLPIIFPVGKPIAFGRSLGFKFFGNLSERSYFGFGVSYGFGWHRKY